MHARTLPHFRAFLTRPDAAHFARHLRRMQLRAVICHDGPVFVVAWGAK